MLENEAGIGRSQWQGIGKDSPGKISSCSLGMEGESWRFLIGEFCGFVKFVKIWDFLAVPGWF